MAFGGGTYVAVGDDSLIEDQSIQSNRPALFHSSNGLAWTKVDLEGGTWLYGVAYGNGRFLAAGGISFQGVQESLLFTSTDGATWTAVPSPEHYAYRRLFFANGRFTAFIHDGDRLSNWIVATSEDGTSWDEVHTVESLDVSMTFARDRFFLLHQGINPTYLQTSFDGAEWTTFEAAGMNRLHYVASVDGRFVGGGAFDCCFGELPDDILYFSFHSTDGENWTVERITDGVVLDRVASGNGIAVGMGRRIGEGGDRSVHTSSDGLAWRERRKLADAYEG